MEPVATPSGEQIFAVSEGCRHASALRSRDKKLTMLSDKFRRMRQVAGLPGRTALPRPST